ncbi:MAG: response regulator [Clostridia bacterium]|nr:response regulator [Clostridia bacterium]MBQ3470878.1 response regulator [Clostridia bacterium]
MAASFGEKIKQIRNQRGLSQQQLADMLNVDRSSVANWETDRRVPNFDTISKMAVFFNININEFTSTAEAKAKTANIIMVDDEKIILNGCAALLRKFFPNGDFNGFTTARSALEYAEKNRVDLAFLDIELGNMSGIELCHRLLELNPRMNIIYLTGYSDYAIDAWDTGACGFLLKPLKEEKVRQALGRLRYPIGGTV